MNAYCELFIYRNSKILRNKNFKVDDIDSYLSTLDTMNKTSSGSLVPIQGQFMKHQLTLTYNIELKQTSFENGYYTAQDILNYKEDFNINYLVAVNCNVDNNNVKKFRKVYYFITGKRWLSENSIQLELEMDVINTMIDNSSAPYDERLHLSEKTMILRQHKDRWKKGLEPNKMYMPVIDIYSEGITPPLFKTSEKTCYALKDGSTFDDNSYYLVYVASEEGTSKPIEIYLVADEALVVNQQWTYWSGVFNAQSELRTRYGAIIYGSDTDSGLSNIGCSITGKNIDTGNDVTFTITASNQVILIRNSFFTFGTIGSNGFTRTGGIINMNLRSRKNVRINGLAVMRVCDRDEIKTSVNLPNITATFINGLPVSTEYAPQQLDDAEVISISDIDRTQGRIAKIVKLPYCPINIEYTLDGKINLPSDWEISDWALDVYFKAIHYRFRNNPSCFVSEHSLDSLEYDLESPSDVLVQRRINSFGDIILRNKEYETKLLHSDYFLKKFVYDSFGFNFRCEFMEDVDGATAFSVRMATTSSMTSNFFFTFPLQEYKIDNEDYSKLMMVSRNNEVILYNSSYLDYIRNGYNFDKKTRNRNLGLSIASLSLGVVGDAAGIKVGWKDNTRAENIAGVVQEVTKNSTSIIKMAGQTAQADQNIEQKLRMSLYQGVSVAGSDDMDLLSEYATDNKPKMLTYKVSEKMEKTLFDLFYYTGYVANFQGIPNTTSRMWFNFVMAEPVYGNEQSFPAELISALSEKYVEGITFLHKVITYDNEQPVNNWDFEQIYENWENNALPIPRLNNTPTSSVQGKREYVIKSDLSAITNIGRLTNNGKLTWRKRRKSDLKVINELTGLDTITIKGNANPRAMDVRIGSVIEKEVSFDDYANANYYWTIEFSENTSGGYNQSIVYDAIIGYIEYV